MNLVGSYALLQVRYSNMRSTYASKLLHSPERCIVLWMPPWCYGGHGVFTANGLTRGVEIKMTSFRFDSPDHQMYC